MTQAPTPMNVGPTDSNDFQCIGCGYNLRAQDVKGTCPECGKPVADSLARDGMHRTDPIWALNMAKGVRWLMYYLMGMVVCTVLMVFISMVAQVVAQAITVQSLTSTQSTPGGPTGQGTAVTVPATQVTPEEEEEEEEEEEPAAPVSMQQSPATVPAPANVVSHNVAVVSSGPVAPTGWGQVVVAIGGIFRELLVLGLACVLIYSGELLTRKEPNREGNPRPCETWRLIARVLLPVWGFLSLVVVAMQLVQLFSAPLDPQNLMSSTGWPSNDVMVLAVMMVFITLNLIVWAVLMYGLFRVAGDVAARIGRPDLESQAKRVVYYHLGILVSLMLMAVMFGAGIGVATYASRWIGAVSACLSCLFLPVMFGLGLALLVEAAVGYAKIAQTVEQQIKAEHPQLAQGV
jgi:hypothetical protein